MGDAAGTDDALDEFDARVADIHARARDQLADLILRFPAETASQSDVRKPVAALAFRPAGLLDNPVKLLGVEPQCGSDVTRARAFRDQTAHGMVKLGPGPFRFLFEIFQPLLSLPCLGQQLLIHIAHSKACLLHPGPGDARGQYNGAVGDRQSGFLGHGHFCAPYAEKCPTSWPRGA